MTNDKQDLETLDAWISRMMEVLEKGNPDPDVRHKLEKEMSIALEMRLKIAGSQPA